MQTCPMKSKPYSSHHFPIGAIVQLAKNYAPMIVVDVSYRLSQCLCAWTMSNGTPVETWIRTKDLLPVSAEVYRALHKNRIIEQRD